jgi:hypothetical protein
MTPTLFNSTYYKKYTYNYNYTSPNPSLCCKATPNRSRSISAEEYVLGMLSTLKQVCDVGSAESGWLMLCKVSLPGKNIKLKLCQKV